MDKEALYFTEPNEGLSSVPWSAAIGVPHLLPAREQRTAGCAVLYTPSFKQLFSVLFFGGKKTCIFLLLRHQFASFCDTNLHLILDGRWSTVHIQEARDCSQRCGTRGFWHMCVRNPEQRPPVSDAEMMRLCNWQKYFQMWSLSFRVGGCSYY